MLLKTKRYFYWFTSMAVAIASYRFLLMGMDNAFANLPLQVDLNPLWFLLHVVTGPIALVLAPVQFSGKIRSKSPELHRWVGRSYVVMVFIAGVSGLIIGFDAEGGTIGRTGFIVLSLIWLWVTAKGLLCAREKQFSEHRKWMIRSAALTFAGVMLRIWLPMQVIAGVPFEIAYPIVAWACWVPNLIIAEYFLIRPTSKSDTRSRNDLLH